MFRKSLTSTLILIIILTFALSACSSIPAAVSSILPQTQAAAAAQQSITNKLAVGTLEMEGTSQAVTAAQAATLLPLWKAVNVMGYDKTASSAEVAALYEQIQGTLTASQLAAIKQMTLSQAELTALTQKYGSTSSSQAAASSKTASSSSSQAQAGAAQDMSGGAVGDITSVGYTTPNTTSQSAASVKTAKTSTGSSADINPTFASAIVTLLKQRTTLE